MIQNRNSGFTLVELTLSMSFIAMLLLGIALLTIQISNVYTKGITLREVNQSGQLISSDIERQLNIAAPTSVTLVSEAEGGRLCVGTVVYAWNFGEYLGDAGALNVRENGTDTDISLVKFTVPASDDFCSRDPDSNEYLPIPDSANEFISQGDRDIALHTFTIDANDISGGQTMYTISFVLGTNETGTVQAGLCQPPQSLVDDQYCAVNEFNFVARAGNKSQ